MGNRKLIVALAGMAVVLMMAILSVTHGQQADATQAIAWIVAAFCGGNLAEHIRRG